MSRGAAAVVAVASIAYLVLVAGTIREAGSNYEEVVPYVLAPLDIRDGQPAANESSTTPGFVTSPYLPRLAFAPAKEVRWPLLNQLYMTDHLSYGGVLLAATGLEPLAAARWFHALFALPLLWMLFDVGLLLGLGTRAAALAIALAATGLQLVICYTPARFDESVSSFGTVAVLWAALHYQREHRKLWVWLGVLAAAFAVSGKLTALWPLGALAAAGAMAGWRLPPWRELAWPGIVSLPLFAPMAGFALAGPSAAGASTLDEVLRRLSFFSNLFTTGVLFGTAANLIDYLGNWGGLASQILRGSDARPPDQLGRVLVALVLVWLVARVLAPGPTPRRCRRETHMLTFAAVVFALVTMFFREHFDYQFVLLVPLHALALAAFLDWCARRFLDPFLPAGAAAVVVCALPLWSNLHQYFGLREDFTYVRNAMTDLAVQRESAAWLANRRIEKPIVTTFWSVGTYELLTRGAVHPVYPFPMLRQAKDRSYIPDFVALWRQLLADAGGDAYVVLPLGENTIESRHFDEGAIRDGLLAVAEGKQLKTFSNARGYPLLEVWRVHLRQSAALPSDPPGGAGVPEGTPR